MITATTKLTRHERGMIEQALKHQDGLSIDDVVRNISTGKYVALRGDRTIATIEETGDALHVAQYAGKLSDLPELAEAFIRIGDELGKPYITMNGRPGWAKILRRYNMHVIKQDKFTHYKRAA